MNNQQRNTMNTQPTPETDAALYPMNGVDIIWPELARKLERERDEAREETIRTREFMDHGFAVAQAELTAVRELRDMLAEEVGQLKSRLTQTQGAVTISRNGYVQELEQQRDRLAEAIITHRAKAFPLTGEDFDQELWQALQSLTPNSQDQARP